MAVEGEDAGTAGGDLEGGGEGGGGGGPLTGEAGACQGEGAAG